MISISPLKTYLDRVAMPIVWRVTAFIMIVCVTLVALDGWRSWSARAIQLRQTELVATNLARSLAQQADDMFDAADIVLVDVVERVQVDGMGPAALPRLQTLLSNRVIELPWLHGIFVYDQHGRWIVTAHAQQVPTGVNNADRAYFIYHRTHPERAVHIGAPIKSRSTGDWVIPVSRRIDHADGSFAGVVLTTLRIDYFRQFYASFDIGKAGTIVFALNDGTVMLRRPYDDAWIGKSMAASPVFHDYSANQTGTAMITSTVDGIVRMTSYRHLDHYPLVVWAALSKDEFLADWRADTYLHSGGVAILTLILGLMGMRLVHHIRRRVQVEADLVRVSDELRSKNQLLETFALQDGLTGLANRRSFDAELKSEFTRAMRNGRPLAMIMIDVDHFKKYNDCYGHPAGDACLRAIADELVANRRRPGDISARYGGEEFVILLPDTNQAGAMAVANKICNAVAQMAIEHRDSPCRVVTISAGVHAFVPVRHDDMQKDLIALADKALYIAKSSGRNRVCFAAMPTASSSNSTSMT